MTGNNKIYFDSFGIEYFLKESRKGIENKSFTINIYRIQAYDSNNDEIVSGHFKF